MDRLTPLRALYRGVCARYLLATDEIEREQALAEATEVGKLGLADGPALDVMYELHRRTQAGLAAAWADAGACDDERAARERLAAGEGTPLMLALALPHELAQRAHHEERWRREHETLLAMFEQTDELIVILDADGYIDDVNPAYCRLTGWTRREAASATRPWDEMLALAGTRGGRADITGRDGRRCVGEWSVSTIRGRKGELISHIAIGRDTTQQRLIEEGLRENDKLRAVATLAGGIAHDFNNLLGSILGLAELCALEAAEGSRQARNLERIQQASSKAAALVRQMLDFSRQTPMDLQAMPIGDVLAHARALLQAALPPGIELEIAVIDDATVRVDLVQIEQVLLNVTRNAAHAMRVDGGRIRILVDRGTPSTTALAGVGCLCVRVVDSGEGIPAQLLPRIFDPFFTTKPVGEGTGLGLAAVHGIVSSHGGAVEVASAPGCGTAFNIFLPLVTQAALVAADLTGASAVTALS